LATEVCLVILDHRNDDYLRETIEGARAFCPEADIVWYDSSTTGEEPPSGVERLPASRPLEYAKVSPFFLDMLEWAAGSEYRYVANFETDMAFVRPGFARFISAQTRSVDHLAPGFARNTPATSRWRPYRSLAPELPQLLTLLGVDSTDRCFSPGQVFSRHYAQTLVASPIYDRLRSFVATNQRAGRSFSLQEVLLPTLTRALGLRIGAYPSVADRYNRYRPYHAAASVARALNEPSVYFVHPIRRDRDDPARRSVRSLAACAA
jgi:hypothetical protein